MRAEHLVGEPEGQQHHGADAAEHGEQDDQQHRAQLAALGHHHRGDHVYRPSGPDLEPAAAQLLRGIVQRDVLGLDPGARGAALLPRRGEVPPVEGDTGVSTLSAEPLLHALPHCVPGNLFRRIEEPPRTCAHRGPLSLYFRLPGPTFSQHGSAQARTATAGLTVAADVRLC